MMHFSHSVRLVRHPRSSSTYSTNKTQDISCSESGFATKVLDKPDNTISKSELGKCRNVFKLAATPMTPQGRTGDAINRRCDIEAFGDNSGVSRSISSLRLRLPVLYTLLTDE